MGLGGDVRSGCAGCQDGSVRCGEPARGDGVHAPRAQVQRDMRVLYKDKLGLHQQLQTASAETADVVASQAAYRKMFEKHADTIA